MNALRRFQRRAARTTAVTSVLLISVALLIVLSFYPASERSNAGIGPKTIRGYVYDSLGNPLAGANVTIVEMTSMSTLWYDSTEPDGFYTVAFDPAYWDSGHTIQVTATYMSFFAVNTTVANLNPIQFVNVTIGSVTIPEFGDVVGSPITFVCLGMIALFVIVRRRSGE